MQLLPVDNPGTPTVSNTKVASSRCVVRNLRLELRVYLKADEKTLTYSGLSLCMYIVHAFSGKDMWHDI